MQKRLIIFDFDGTILDSIPWILKTLNKIAPIYGKSPISDEEFESLRSHTIRDLINKFKLPLYQIPFVLIRSRREIEKDLDRIGLCKGIDEALVQLKDKGYKLGILSSSPKKNIEYVLNKYKLNMFEFVKSELNIFGKAAAISKICKEFSLQKDEVVYIGDEIRDFEACREAGVDIISVTWGFNNEKGFSDAGSTHIVNDPSEISGLVADF